MKITAANPLPDQIKEIYNSLAQDRNSNFGRLEYFLKQIVMNRDITFLVSNKQGGLDELVVPAKKAWEIIATWSQGEGNLPVGDKDPRFNIRSRATHLLDYIQTNVSGKTAEAAGSYRLMLEQAKYPAPPVSDRAESSDELNLQKVFDLRRKQIALLESRFMSPLTNNLSKSKLFSNIPDAATRVMVLQMIAAGNANFRHNPKDGFQNFTAEKLHQMLLHQPGIRNINSVMRLAYAKNAQEEFEETSSIINSTIKQVYKDEGEYQQDMVAFRSLSNMAPGLDSIQYLVNSLNISADPKDNAALIKSIRSHIIAAARQDHIDGTSLLKSALKSAGFSEISVDHFQSLVPYVEEIQIKQRHLLLGSDLSDHDARLISTSGLAEEFGVDLATPWLKKKDLDTIAKRVLASTDQEYKDKKLGELSSQKTLALQQAFDFEYSKGDKANLHKLSELSSLMSKYRDFGLYHDSVDGNFGYKFQELFSKGIGNYRAVKQPIDRFTEKVWGGIENIDDIIRGPQRKLASWWEETQEKHPWLNPAALISGKWVEYQTGIAIKIHDWAIKVSTSNAWLRSFAGHVADFTEGFVKHEAHWSGAGSFFISRKIGNTLDWATKFASKGKHGTFTSLRFAIANRVWDGFSKMAPGLASKMALDGFKKVIIGIIGGEMTMGVSIAIQIGWEAIKYGFSFLKKLLTDSKFRERFINRIPLLVGGLISGGIIFLSGIPTAIVAGIGIVGGAIFALLQGAIMSLAPLFGLAAAVAFGAVAFFSILWYGLIAPTFQLDSNSGLAQIVTNIICDDDSSTTTVEPAPKATGNAKIASCAECLVKYLTACYGGGTLTGEVVTSKIGCLIASKVAPDVVATIQASATDYTWLQCVGFAQAAARCAGTTLPSNGTGVAAGYLTVPISGYSLIKGGQNCQPGDFGLIDGLVGHIFVTKDNLGGTITGIDANYIGDGMVSNNTPFPTSMVAGCLRKM